MLNQLFSRKPNPTELTKILNCYNLKDLEDTYIISSATLKFHKTVQRLYDIVGILMELYLPCKYYYFSNLDQKSAITILRQIVKLFDKNVKYSFIVNDKVKIVNFYINSDNQYIKIEKNKIIKFD
tara:strand:+ start:2058 stop:2432 length:375 start_codon:yes stop_codon:yes gene_type:complete